MSAFTIPPVLPAAPPSQPTESARARDAAQQFEGLLLAQILRSVRESGAGLGKIEQSGDCATDFAEQQLARVLAQQGGLGLAALIAAGLERKPADPATGTTSP